MSYLVLALLLTNFLEAIIFAVVLYKLVTQLSSKIISPNISSYAVAERSPDAPRTPKARTTIDGEPVTGRPLKQESTVQSGRLDEFSPLDEEV
jgi:hypothetical protein